MSKMIKKSVFCQSELNPKKIEDYLENPQN
jgi:hypothetical protein